MSQDLARITSDQTPAWGKANPRRGENHVDAALAFLKAFPVGATLSVDAFDDWAHQQGYLNLPMGAPKQSDVWLAHLQRRHQLRYNINKASAHPRMTEFGVEPFTVDTTVAGRTLEVRAVHTAIGKNSLARKISSVVETKRKQLDYLLQSADFDNLPAYERTYAEALHDDITMFERLVHMQADGLNDKFAKLSAKLRKAVESGTVKAINGGLTALFDGADRDESRA